MMISQSSKGKTGSIVDLSANVFGAITAMKSEHSEDWNVKRCPLG
jgi:predicted outer membrane lipoprotein